MGQRVQLCRFNNSDQFSDHPKKIQNTQDIPSKQEFGEKQKNKTPAMKSAA
jgi:hypothetical protein